eukprot:233210-Chlamydomonas_euryale.AAC.7
MSGKGRNALFLAKRGKSIPYTETSPRRRTRTAEGAGDPAESPSRQLESQLVDTHMEFQSSAERAYSSGA